MEPPNQKLVIGVVGVCGAGKSTLMQALKEHGIKIHHIAQEHSYVQSMWQRIIHPDLLIYLNVSYPETIRRRKLDWTIYEYQEQLRRLENARQHADLTVETDTLSEGEVIEQVLSFLIAHDVYPHYPANSNQ